MILICMFMMTKMLSTFSCTYWPLLCQLGKEFYFFAHFLLGYLLLLIYKSFLYTPDTVLCQIDVLQVLSPRLLIIFLMPSLDVQTFFIFVRSNLSIFNFMVSAFHAFSMKSLPPPGLQEILYFFYKFYDFRVYVYCAVTELIFCMCCEVGNEINFFCQFI